MVNLSWAPAPWTLVCARCWHRQAVCTLPAAQSDAGEALLAAPRRSNASHVTSQWSEHESLHIKLAAEGALLAAPHVADAQAALNKRFAMLSILPKADTSCLTSTFAAEDTRLAAPHEADAQAAGDAGAHDLMQDRFHKERKHKTHIQLAAEDALLAAPHEADAQAARNAGAHDPGALAMPTTRQLPAGAQLHR